MSSRSNAVPPLSRLGWSLPVLAGLGLMAGCGATRPGERPPDVILITVDTLRADRLGCYGDALARTPTIDGLARHGVQFLAASAPAPTTLPSHSTVLTGLYPSRHGVRTNGSFRLPETAVTLAERLAGRGYRTGAIIGALPLARRFGLDQGFERYDDRFDEDGAQAELQATQHRPERRAARVTDAALDWLATIPAGDPVLLWVHYFDPHAEYRPPAPFDAGVDPYRGEVAYVDAELGRLLGALEAAGRGGAIKVLVGDHGEALGDHGEPTHGLFIYQATIHVPFLVVWPGQLPEGRQVDDVASLVDVTPTILALTGAEAPADLQGTDLGPVLRGSGHGPSRSGVVLESLLAHHDFGWAELFGLREGHWKYIDAPREELYDLEADPGESRNLATVEPERAATMRARLRELLADGGDADGAAIRQTVDPETARQLESLGYLGGGELAAAERARTAGTAPDPKDRIDAYRGWLEANALILTGRNQEASERLASLLAADPGNRYIQLQLAWQRVESGAYDEATRLYQQLVADELFRCRALLGLAVVGERAGLDPAELADRYRTVLACDPEDGGTHAKLSVLLAGAGRIEEAVAHLERAVALAPSVLEYRDRLAAFDLEQGRTDQAVRLWQELIELEPESVVARDRLGVIELALGRHERARQWFIKALARDPQDAAANHHLGGVLLIMDRAAEAVPYLERAVAAGSRVEPIPVDRQRPGEWGGDPLVDLTQALVASGNLPEARRRLAQIEARGPGALPGIAHLAVVCEAAGLTESAAALRRRLGQPATAP